MAKFHSFLFACFVGNISCCILCWLGEACLRADTHRQAERTQQSGLEKMLERDILPKKAGRPKEKMMKYMPRCLGTSSQTRGRYSDSHVPATRLVEGRPASLWRFIPTSYHRRS